MRHTVFVAILTTFALLIINNPLGITMTLFDKNPRIIGVLFLLQFTLGILVNFFFTGPLFGEPGFITNGALFSKQVGFSVLLGLLNAGLGIVIAILAWPIFRQYSANLAIAFLLLSGVGLCLNAVENMQLMSLVSFSQAYTDAGIIDKEVLNSVSSIVSASRNWAHYIGLIISGVSLMVFYTILLRSKLTPLVIALFGVIAVSLQIMAVSMPLLGMKVNFLMLAPLALSQLLMATWLIIKGFNRPEDANNN